MPPFLNSDPCYTSGMSRYFESEQAFLQRLNELNLVELKPRFLELGWKSFAIFAFASDYVPGVSAAELFIEEVVKKLTTDADIDRWKPLLKRLFVEAYTMAAHDIQGRGDGRDVDEPKRMPNAEREYRLSAIAASLPGLRLEGELLPSYHLIDLVANMLETGVITYVGWEKCGKRDSELNGIKMEKVWKPDASGHIREIETGKPQAADYGSDLLLKYALQRRGVALEIANVCSYNGHSLLVECLFDALLRQPPPNFSKVSINQLRQADEEMFRRIAASCRNGLKSSPDGTRPFEAALKANLFDPGFRYMLMPLRRRGKGKGGATEEEGSGGKQGKGKGRGKKQGKPNKRPHPMENKARETSSGEPLCFDFNLRGCPDAKAGQKCARGWHLCAEHGCQKPHSMSEH